MTDGLGIRYAFMGPFETCHLNAEGMMLSLLMFNLIVFVGCIMYLLAVIIIITLSDNCNLNL